jgi:hypothetical protein
VTLGVAGHVVSRISAGLETAIPRGFEFQSATARNGTINGTFRDIIYSGLVKARVAGTLDVVGGISIVKEDLVATTPIQNDLGLSLGYVMGADVGVPISPHVLIVPGIRVHLIQRGLFERSQIGLGSAEVQGGVAVRVVF